MQRCGFGSCPVGAELQRWFSIGSALSPDYVGRSAGHPVGNRQVCAGRRAHPEHMLSRQYNHLSPEVGSSEAVARGIGF